MRYIELGITGYSEAFRLQLEIVQEVAAGLSEDTLIITEHRPVITIGRRGSWSNVLKTGEFLSARGVEILRVDRGGDVTYHGPGQLIAYPIFKLRQGARDLHGFLRFLEEAGIHFLGKYGVKAERVPGFRGVWVNGAKIGSIGIGVKKWVTYHGAAINISTDLTYFSLIRPCGMDRVRMISLEGILGEKIDIVDARRRLRESFEEVSSLAQEVSAV
ncbi:MAG: lipoyl(octanoyl) transferase LipB [Candidatus Omnitrophota bacterium]